LPKASLARIPTRSQPQTASLSHAERYVIVTVSFLYLSILFAIAYYGDRRADQGRSIIASPYIFALSIAVYAQPWTFYGSVGRAASSGVSFLPIYLGPTLTFILGWFLIRKIIRISKVNRITSIADFVASRYGKSSFLGGLVTIIAIVGIMPYISLQLKAISTSFAVLQHYPDIEMPAKLGSTPVLQDTALYVAVIMAAFAILFGTRHIDASERHEGMVAAIAFGRWSSCSLSCGWAVRHLRHLAASAKCSRALPAIQPSRSLRSRPPAGIRAGFR
jgi:Na+/proline symporter